MRSNSRNRWSAPMEVKQSASTSVDRDDDDDDGSEVDGEA